MPNKHVLIVEDEAPIRDMIRFALERAGFSVAEAEDAQTARVMAADQRPDLILLDWMLPGVSGTELAREWRQEELTADLPIIMVTARVDEDDRIRGLNLGADDYVTKPFSSSELVARVRAVLRRSLPGGEDEFVFDIDATLALFGRQNEIDSVFANLLANAARYTPAGGQIDVIWQSDQNGVRFAVCDNGPGIAHEHLARLTERFYRIDKGRKASDGGTGLGLAIVKHCLEHHESVLEIESAPGKGSIFSCRFPATRAVARRAA